MYSKQETVEMPVIYGECGEKIGHSTAAYGENNPEKTLRSRHFPSSY
jgi:hypothetical protein